MIKYKDGEKRRNMEISKKDWKLFCDKLPEWQERYMNRLANEYVKLLSDKDKKASERFWELDKLIRLDKKNPGVLLELRKSNTVIDIMRLLRNDVISLEDLKDFSEELREAVATYKE